MSLNLAAFLPHPPLAIPTIGGDNIKAVAATIKAYQHIQEQIYQARLDTLIIISAHGHSLEQAFAINHAPQMHFDFSQFGDLNEYQIINNDMSLGYNLREYMETRIPVVLYNEEAIDYGAAVPLYYLLQNQPNIMVVPVHTSHLNYERHVQFGEMIKEITWRSNKRIGVIAAGDLSHTLTEEAPAGFNPAGKEFDKLIISLIKQKQLASLGNISSDLVNQAVTCGYRPFLTLLGITKNVAWQPDVLAYEAPVGVGYLSLQFIL
ncbi:MAG: AmmeMemoRadiSam system protein B [Candidatus Komeilibacteria bacterium]